ncbi:MAG TPA: hypothetical protein VKZ18_18090 [Polyangia bacterium]|nr:hypothetical protein [Polyangia bacterium]
MMRDEDSPELVEDDPTHANDLRPRADTGRRTRSYKSAEFLAGRDAGFKDGVEGALAALKIELVRAGCSEDEVKHIVARVRASAAERR